QASVEHGAHGRRLETLRRVRALERSGRGGHAHVSENCRGRGRCTALGGRTPMTSMGRAHRAPTRPTNAQRVLWLIALACLWACAAPRPLAAAPEVTLAPTRVSEHCWFFQGESGPASAANKGFMSNAGFVVTGDG